MKFDHQVFCALQINGESLPVPERMTMREAMQWFVQQLVESPIESRNFSSLTLQMSKREITGVESDNPLLRYASVVDDDATLDGFPDLPLAEFMELIESCATFNAMRRVAYNPAEYSDSELRIIHDQFQAKYGSTKWAQLYAS